MSGDQPITEPPILKNFSEDHINELVVGNTEKLESFRKLPCHTQPVERCIKMVTEASKQVCGQTKRDAAIAMKVKGRNIVPKFDTKSDFSFGNV